MHNHYNLAAIDLGTNSFHLMIVQIHKNGSFTTILKDKELTRLGSGFDKNKNLNDDTLEKAFNCLKRFKSLAESHDAQIKAIATSALREANNRTDFINKIKENLGFSIEVISGYEEARLIFLGVQNAIVLGNKKFMLVDIGGGSTEILIGKQNEIFYSTSLKMGAVRLTERFFQEESYTKNQIKKCRLFIESTLSDVIPEIKYYNPEVLVGSSGTVLSIANIIKTNKNNDQSKLNNFCFTNQEFKATIKTLENSDSLKKRSKILGLDPKRSEIILGGSLILEKIIDSLPFSSVTVSEFALREGIVYDTVQKNSTINQIEFNSEDIRIKSVNFLMNQFSVDKEYSNQIKKLSTELFKLTKLFHKLNQSDLIYLESAALLHDVGFKISHSGFHKHGYYIIRNSEFLLGFNYDEIEIIALTVRFQRKSAPKIRHSEFQNASQEIKEKVLKLSSILRLAIALNKTKKNIIKDLTINYDEMLNLLTIYLNIDQNMDPHLELWEVENQKEHFENIFDVKLKFELEKRI